MAGGRGDARRDRRHGFILIEVLWMVAALATLAAVFSAYVSRTAALSHVVDDRLQAEASIRGAVELTALQLLSVPDGTGATGGHLAARIGRTDVVVRYLSEGARVDLNAAPKELLAGLFAATGASEGAAADYADRIVAWRTRPPSEGLDTEVSDYHTAGLAYPPRRAPFADVLELPLVHGIPRAAVDRVLPFVTVFNGHAEIDVLNAAPEVVAALPGMTSEVLDGILAQRGRRVTDPEATNQALAAAGKLATTEGRPAIRATIEVAFGQRRKVGAEVVFLLLKEGDEPYRILDWHDDFDQPF